MATGKECKDWIQGAWLGNELGQGNHTPEDCAKKCFEKTTVCNGGTCVKPYFSYKLDNGRCECTKSDMDCSLPENQSNWGGANIYRCGNSFS